MSLTFDQAVRHYAQEHKRLNSYIEGWEKMSDTVGVSSDDLMFFRLLKEETRKRMSMSTERLHTLIELYHESEIT